MKTIKLFLLLIPFITFSQNQIKLKSGESIDGNVKSLVNGILTVTIKGNNLTFKQSDVESIFFQKEKAQTQLQAVNQAQKATIKGVITYFFNKNYGDKPDVGAKIYIRKADTLNKKSSDIDLYQRVKVCRSLIKMNSNVEQCKKTLQDSNIQTDKDFDELNTRVIHDLMNIEFNNSIKKITADGNGNYSTSIEPGLYEVIYISKGRTDLTVAEIQGKIDSNIIDLKAGDEVIKDKRFDMY